MERHWEWMGQGPGIDKLGRCPRQRQACEMILIRRNQHIPYSLIAHSINVVFSHPFHLHIINNEVWLSANSVTSEPALAAANCPRALAVNESTDVRQRTETQS